MGEVIDMAMATFNRVNNDIEVAANMVLDKMHEIRPDKGFNRLDYAGVSGGVVTFTGVEGFIHFGYDVLTNQKSLDLHLSEL